MPAVAERLAPLAAQLDDEIAHDDRAVRPRRRGLAHADTAGLGAEQRRLTEVARERMKRQGAGLAGEADRRASRRINAPARGTVDAFQAEPHRRGREEVVFIEEESGLDGLGDAQRRAAAATAAARGRPGILGDCQRTGRGLSYLRHPVATCASRSGACGRPGRPRRSDDNQPLIAETLQLREKASCSAPELCPLRDGRPHGARPAAMARMLEDTWGQRDRRGARQSPTIRRSPTAKGLASASSPGIGSSTREAAARALRFDGDAVKAHLPLDAVIAAMFWSPDAPTARVRPHCRCAVVHPACRVFAVSRGARRSARMYFDLINRPGKIHGSYQFEIRPHESFRGQVLPIAR